MKFFSINWFKFVAYNFFNSKIKRNKKAYIFPYYGSFIKIQKSAVLHIGGNVHLGVPNLHSKRHVTAFIIKEDATLSTGAFVHISRGTVIEASKKAVINLGFGSIGTDVLIKSKTCISIGNDFLISRDVIIRDDDGHRILKEDYVDSKPITIGDKVWICERCCIMKGANIGNNVVVGYDTLVNGAVGNNCVYVNKRESKSYSIESWSVK